ncbi:MAG: hypothetical protein HJJLKODD_01710 [Phycisphaerae bacterium]|nr:hypothetical protein [Phycisphaerae bacterium]
MSGSMGSWWQSSRWLQWGFRLALMFSLLGLLWGLNLVLYADLLDGAFIRVAGGIALCSSSVVLAVSVILGRRLRRRSKELAQRMARLEQHLDKLTRYIITLPQQLEKKWQEQWQELTATTTATPAAEPATSNSAHTDVVDQVVVRDATIVVTHPPAAPEVIPSDGIIDPAPDENLNWWQPLLETLWAEVNGELPIDSMEAIRRWRKLVQELAHQPLWNERLRGRLQEAEHQLLLRWRGQLVEAIRAQLWLPALAIGQQIRELFPTSRLASEIQLLEPRLSARIQQQIDQRRARRQHERPSRNRGTLPTDHSMDSHYGLVESGTTLHGMELQPADQVVKSA